jgi:hypothetical protein
MSTSNAIPAEPKKVRKFWVALPMRQYMRLELSAFSHDETPYTLVPKVVTAWLEGRLVPVEDGAAPSPSPSVAKRI